MRRSVIISVFAGVLFASVVLSGGVVYRLMDVPPMPPEMECVRHGSCEGSSAPKTPLLPMPRKGRIAPANRLLLA